MSEKFTGLGAAELAPELETTEDTAREAERAKVAAMVENFMAAEAAELTRAEQLFHSDNYADIWELNNVFARLLQSFQQLSNDQGKHFEHLPSDVFAAIIGHDYAERVEQRSTEIGDRYGLYLPMDELGGGDYLDRREVGGGVIEATLADYVSHGVRGDTGEGGMWPKLLALRLMEVRAAALAEQEAAGYPLPDEPGYINPDWLFPDLDDFMLTTPFEQHTMELTLARFQPTSEGGGTLELESTGVRMLWRDENGELRLIKQAGSYSMIGSGAVAGIPVPEGEPEPPPFQREVQTFTVPPGTAVFLTTDGLLDVETGNQIDNGRGGTKAAALEDEVAALGRRWRDLPHDEFLEALKDWVRQQWRQGNRTTHEGDLVTDDVTILGLNL